jgi:hypothetical protein
MPYSAVSLRLSIVEERLGGYQLAASSARAGPQDTCAFRPKALISPQE